MIYTKPGVLFGGFTRELLVILGGLQQLSEEFKCDITITSGSDGEHDKNSKHYTYKALDIRSKLWGMKKKLAVQIRLTQILGPKFTVLLEYSGEPNEHLHIQLKKGLSNL